MEVICPFNMASIAKKRNNVRMLKMDVNMSLWINRISINLSFHYSKFDNFELVIIKVKVFRRKKTSNFSDHLSDLWLIWIRFSSRDVPFPKRRLQFVFFNLNNIFAYSNVQYRPREPFASFMLEEVNMRVE